MSSNKTIVLLLLLCTYPFIVQPQTEQKQAPFHFGLVYPVSTNGAKASQISNAASVHLLGGISLNENTFILSGLTSIIKNNAYGFQLAGLSNHIGNEGYGVAVSGLMNIYKVSYSGLMFAGLINAGGNVKGAQFAGILNKAKTVDGMQISGFVNIAEKSNTPIGLLNFIKDGEKSISLSYDYLQSVTLTFKSGSKNTSNCCGFII